MFHLILGFIGIGILVGIISWGMSLELLFFGT